MSPHEASPGLDKKPGHARLVTRARTECPVPKRDKLADVWTDGVIVQYGVSGAAAEYGSGREKRDKNSKQNTGLNSKCANWAKNV
ncbi:hypothetical protein G9P44_005214 [Scheffersomyces stipitis]|nr:hypothetical protein G9P44_005214 [Scheffersomyces stipitis]